MEFLGAGKGGSIRQINDLLAEGVAKAHGGSMLTNSFYGVMDEQLLTVHPLGYVVRKLLSRPILVANKSSLAEPPWRPTAPAQPAW